MNKRKTVRHYQLKQHWAKMWKTRPALMKRNLDRINAHRRLRKAERVERVTQVIKRLPAAFPASQSRGLMAQALASLSLDATPARLKRLRVYAVRYGLLSFDQGKKLWQKVT